VASSKQLLTIKNMDSLNFGKDSAIDKYIFFIQDYEEYNKDDLSILKAKRVATSAWHLVDWVFKDFILIHNFTDLGLFRQSLYPNCESLKIMHDLANADKHLKLSNPKGDIKNTKEHKGVYSNVYSNIYDISCLQIEKNDGTKLNFKREIKKVKEFWDNYFANL
jgi:hypothetical protein